MMITTQYHPDLITRLITTCACRPESTFYVLTDGSQGYVKFAGNRASLTIEVSDALLTGRSYTSAQIDLLERLGLQIEPSTGNWQRAFRARIQFTAQQLDLFQQAVNTLLRQFFGLRPGQPVYIKSDWVTPPRAHPPLIEPRVITLVLN